MRVTIFDIETGPRPESELVEVLPEFSAPANYKDPSKIAESIAAQRAAWMEKAALSAVTGRIVAIGTRVDGVNRILADESEADQLRAFWSIAEDCVRERRALVGFNINRFDLPFLIRRSWHHGVSPPDGLFSSRGYANPEFFVDLAAEWQCGDRQEFIKLDTLAKFLGVGAKNGDGKDFATLWATERKLAMAYLENDLALTARVMERLLGISEVSGVSGGPPEIAPPQSPDSTRPGAVSTVTAAAASPVPAVDDY